MIDNPTKPTNPIIAARRSPRAITGPVPERSVITALLEAARWAPSAFNEQPWRFVVATAEDPEVFERLLGCLNEGNQVWCKHAPILALCVVKNFFDREHAPNQLDAFDLGLAVENFLLEAVHQGLVAHPMSGFSPEKARAVFRIPEGYDPKIVIAAGYGGDPSALPHDLAEMERAARVRRPVSEIAFDGEWDRAWKR